MKDDFFDWLNDCPTNWVLHDDEDGRTYFFIDNGEDNENGE